MNFFRRIYPHWTLMVSNVAWSTAASLLLYLSSIGWDWGSILVCAFLVAFMGRMMLEFYDELRPHIRHGSYGIQMLRAGLMLILPIAVAFWVGEVTLLTGIGYADTTLSTLKDALGALSLVAIAMIATMDTGVPTFIARYILGRMKCVS